jgi:gluconolactonase
MAQSQDAIPAAPSGDPRFFPLTSKLEKVFGDGFFTEGPAVAPDGSVYFSDITFTSQSGMQAGHIWRYEPKTGRTSVFRSPSGMSNGILFDREGDMLVAEGADFGGRCVTRTDMSTGKAEILVALYNGRPFNSPNDLSMDMAGRIYFTDPRYSGHEPVEQPVQGVYRIDTDGTVHLIIADAGKPNGVAVSPDQKTLYVAALDDGAFGELPPGMSGLSGRMALLAYDLATDGTAKLRKILVDFASEAGPDGIKVDQEGNIWVTRPSEPFGIKVFSPEGKELAFLPLPEGPANLAFGHGQSSRTLYITAQKCLYRIEVGKPGYHPFR